MLVLAFLPLASMLLPPLCNCSAGGSRLLLSADSVRLRPAAFRISEVLSKAVDG